ncbi:5,6-dimethylbenzimidazole synthase [Fulvimarina sp. 2208YS6-2-32]|uniref:5,6-dimethylbenzimidazole synthase n=1 Tax=Fulvimarina uroteuthidis TaxID=3098149 RepID=A0ABU5I2P5_9HYPH|nr:5,6-dimethylbenzimidazole synthase [Fulvimarina sp. 2208YS6-2-32]MDY8109627.1 5,6-dimethylbenzimidazole synthase [Fulvimarina sp. 2208YS6-2-32]
MSDGPPEFDADFRARLDALMVWRRDVRRFRVDRVPDDLMARVLRAFELAPSVGNSQPWRLVSVESDTARARIRESFRRCNAAALAATDPRRSDLYARLKLAGLEAAPVQLAIFCDPDPAAGHGLGRRTMPETLDHSVAGAATLFALMARAHGLGVGWVSILEPRAVSAALTVPADWRLVAYLCVGYPEGEDDVPELERAGWQERRAARMPLRR